MISHLFHYIYEPIKLIDSSIFGRHFSGPRAHINQLGWVTPQREQGRDYCGWIIGISAHSAASFGNNARSIGCRRGYDQHWPTGRK